MTTPALPVPDARVAVEEAAQVSVARTHAVRAARASGMAATRVDVVALVATELAENLHRHGRGGELIIGARPGLRGAPGRLSVIAIDRGPGVEHFERCFVDGYSTKGTMGGGLGAVRRLSDDFDAASEVDRGTVVAAGFALPSGGRAGIAVPSGDPSDVVIDQFDVAAIGIPIDGETVNGDQFSTVRRGSRLIVLLADGLGHGEFAAQASYSAVRDLIELADLEPARLLEELSRRMTSSRGAAVTVADLDLGVARDGGTLVSAGLGNVSLLVAAPDGHTRRIATSHGTAGVRTRRALPEQRTEFPARGVLVAHTDGLTTRWSLDGRVELLRHSSEVIASTLWRDHVRRSDDSMIVVVKARPRSVRS